MFFIALAKKKKFATLNLEKMSCYVANIFFTVKMSCFVLTHFITYNRKKAVVQNNFFLISILIFFRIIARRPSMIILLLLLLRNSSLFSVFYVFYKCVRRHRPSAYHLSYLCRVMSFFSCYVKKGAA